MPTTPTLKGDGTVNWGTAAVYASGIITNGRKLRTSDTAFVLNNVGFAVTKIYFNHRNECEFEMIVQTAAPTLAIGDTVTIGGVSDCLVDDTESMWKQDDVEKFRVKATAYDAITS